MGYKEGYKLSAKYVSSEKVLQEMQAAGHPPDAFTFTTMISLYAKAAMCASPYPDQSFVAERPKNAQEMFCPFSA
jgi:hypothetical protein